jgi:hypothetical protein
MGEMSNARFWSNILKVKRMLGRPGHTLENNIRMGLKEVRWKGKNWIHLAQDSDQWRAIAEQ